MPYQGVREVSLWSEISQGKVREDEGRKKWPPCQIKVVSVILQRFAQLPKFSQFLNTCKNYSVEHNEAKLIEIMAHVFLISEK